MLSIANCHRSRNSQPPVVCDISSQLELGLAFYGLFAFKRIEKIESALASSVVGFPCAFNFPTRLKVYKVSCFTRAFFFSFRK
jgi:hypothetical protein